MTRRVDQVDQEVGAVGLLALNVLEILLVRESGVQRDGGRLDGNTTCDTSVYKVATSTPRLWEKLKTYAPARQHECRWHGHHQPFRWR